MKNSALLDPEVCRKARISRDARFDGQFFTAVKTTGIFCRPVCPATSPKEQNVDYYQSAAAAMAAGFRPCLRCRPETAPRSAAWRGIEALAARLLAKIDAGFLSEHSVPELAESMGISERYVRDLCQRYAATSPNQLEQTRRSLLAKQLLFDSNLSIADIAFSSGYQSVRRFNEHWKAQFGKAPSEMRKKIATPVSDAAWIEVKIPVVEHFDYQSVFNFLKSRLVKGVETLIDDEQGNPEYQRVLRMGDEVFLISVCYQVKSQRLLLKCEQEALTKLPKIIAIIKRVFDVETDAAVILAHLGDTDEFRQQVANLKDIRLPAAFSAFEAAMRAVVGQQVSVKAACTLLTRISERCANKNTNVSANDLGLTHALPTAEEILAADLSGLGLTGARIASLQAIAQLNIEHTELFDSEYMPDEQRDIMREKLLALKGIGPWTVSYLEMRAFSLPDAFPAGDLGVRIALEEKGVRPSEKQVREQSLTWAPWRAYATVLLWQRLE